MRMLRWAGGKTKKDHIKSEDIWREANIEPMTHKLHTNEMGMLRWARGKTKKDHIKNEDIWREANIEPMTHKLHTTDENAEMGWRQDQEGPRQE